MAGIARPSMTETTDTYLLLRAFVDELARCGLRAALHLARLALDADRAVARARAAAAAAGRTSTSAAPASSRSALAKQRGRPAAVACTSGTAAATTCPAVIEAREARVPLIVLTADRPPELREVGAGQTIDQLKLYGDAVKWFFEVGTHAATPERLRWMRTLACRAVLDGGRRAGPGPVHLNFPLREPLVLDGRCPTDAPGRADGRPCVARPRAPAAPSAVFRRARRRAARVIVAGRDERDAGARPRRSRAFAAAAPAARCSPTRSRARAAGRPRSPTTTRCCATRFAAEQRPELVAADRRPADVQAAARMARRRSTTPTQVALDPEGAWQDPAGVVGERPRRRPGARSARADAEARAAPSPPGSRAGARADAAAARGDRRGARRRAAQRAARRPPRWAPRCRPRRRCSSPRRCRSATSRRSCRRATTRRACSPTAAPTASTARSPPRSASPRRARPGRAAASATSRSPTTSAALLSARAARPRADDRARRQRRRRDLRLPRRSPPGATPSRSTSRPRTGLDFARPPRCSGCATSASRRRPARCARGADGTRRCTCAPTAPRTSRCTGACGTRSPRAANAGARAVRRAL